MAENALYSQQYDLLDQIGNKYTKNWGTLLTFLGMNNSLNGWVEVEDTSFLIDRINSAGHQHGAKGNAKQSGSSQRNNLRGA